MQCYFCHLVQDRIIQRSFLRYCLCATSTLLVRFHQSRDCINDIFSITVKYPYILITGPVYYECKNYVKSFLPLAPEGIFSEGRRRESRSTKSMLIRGSPLKGSHPGGFKNSPPNHWKITAFQQFFLFLLIFKGNFELFKIFGKYTWIFRKNLVQNIDKFPTVHL